MDKKNNKSSQQTKNPKKCDCPCPKTNTKKPVVCPKKCESVKAEKPKIVIPDTPTFIAPDDCGVDVKRQCYYKYENCEPKNSDGNAANNGDCSNEYDYEIPPFRLSYTNNFVCQCGPLGENKKDCLLCSSWSKKNTQCESDNANEPKTPLAWNWK